MVEFSADTVDTNDRSLKSFMRKRIYEIFVVTVMTILACYGILFTLYNAQYAVLAIIVAEIILLISLIANLKYDNDWSKLIFILGGNFSIYGTNLGVGYAMGTEAYYFAALAAGMLIFDVDDPVPLIISSLIPMVFFTFQELGLFLEWVEPPTDFPYETFKTVNFIGSYALLIFYLGCFVKIRKDMQKKLILQNANARLATIGELASGVGHEINNPLMIVAGNRLRLQRELQKANLMTDSIDDCLKKQEIAIERITNIVKGLRNFSRLDPPEESTVCLIEILKENYDLLSNMFSSEAIQLFLDCHDLTTAPVVGFRSQLQQVFMNLLTNARDAVRQSPKKEIHIDITYEKKQNIYSITITDTGCGISDEIIDKIFDPFFTTKPVGQGTGIGLSLSSNIVKQHKGRLKVKSNINEGSTFIVELPRLAIDDEKM